MKGTMNNKTGLLTRGAHFTVVIDGSPTDSGVVSWSAALAHKTGAQLDLVYTMPTSGWSAAMAASLETSDYPSQIRQRGQQHLDDATRLVREADPDTEPSTSVSELSPARLAEKAAEHATMLIVGGGESGPLRDVVFGNSTITMVNAATCPVLVWRPKREDSPGEARPVVVGVDGSEHSKRALAAAFELANVLQVELLAVHIGAVHETDELDYGTSIDWQHLREAERKWLQNIVEPYRADYPSVAVEALSVGASAARELRALSATAQILVVGSRGHGRVAGLLLGSVSHNLVHHAECPVLVVH
ncbi:universal stress protein [Rhodococcoides yunnanense]|uniref:universal stress protein n=1 Tax=Rhodococcoides yunnanense TaxID=278209 RepID=UPI0022B09AC5|nr:universal stress protein [Rhodococcus yunnanensis]